MYIYLYIYILLYHAQKNSQKSLTFLAVGDMCPFKAEPDSFYVESDIILSWNSFASAVNINQWIGICYFVKKFSMVVYNELLKNYKKLFPRIPPEGRKISESIHHLLTNDNDENTFDERSNLY